MNIITLSVLQAIHKIIMKAEFVLRRHCVLKFNTITKG